MLTTDCGFLENELMDVVRLFKSRPQSVTHAFRFDGGVFYNDFVVDGKAYSFKDEGQGCDEIEFKRLERRFGKLGLYAVLSELYKEDMPWGALTGIRPTKMAYTEKEAGRPFRPLFEKMRVKEENIALVEEVLRAQEGIYEKKDGNTDFFVSIPFCPTKCSYCSFITAPIDKTRGFLPDYLDCLEREIFAAAPLTGNLRSVYIGGGTPLVLESEALERVLKAVERVRTNGCEYTVEAGRPDVFTEEKLRLLKEYGVTRICVNRRAFRTRRWSGSAAGTPPRSFTAHLTWRRNSASTSTRPDCGADGRNVRGICFQRQRGGKDGCGQYYGALSFA